MRRVPLALCALLPLLGASDARAHTDQSATLDLRCERGALVAELRTKAEPFFHALASDVLTLESYRDLEARPEPERREWRNAMSKTLRLAVELEAGETWLTPALDIPAPADEWFRARYTADLGGKDTVRVLNGLSLGKLLVRQVAPAGPEQFVDAGQTSEPLSTRIPAPPPTGGAVALEYLKFGYEHIVPEGVDHILFVLGLFLLSTQLKPLLLQVTAFTVAHSVTLALSMYEVVALPSSVVEPLIALSIVYVAVENIFTKRLTPWRPVVVFLFGLLHGLGFASVLVEQGPPRERFVTALVTFNVGVEFGQLTVVLGALALVWRARTRDGYRKRIVIPGSVLIALVGLYWAIERTFL